MIVNHVARHNFLSGGSDFFVWGATPGSSTTLTAIRHVCKYTDLSSTDALTLAQHANSMWRAVARASGLGMMMMMSK